MYSFWENIPGPTQLQKRPFVHLFLKKIIEKLGENRKKWRFSKTFLDSVTKIPNLQPYVY